ncbi:MAG: DNA/RNA helicase domain-containing protein [bacterium]
MTSASDGAGQCGWDGSLPQFYQQSADQIVARLNGFVRDASPEQVSAWHLHVPNLQGEYREWTSRDDDAREYFTVLEYQLPYELRRPDVIVLAGAAVVVLEMKGHWGLGRAALDQVAAYARDLSAYHAECAGRVVVPVLVSSSASRPSTIVDGVCVCHPRDLDAVLERVTKAHPGHALAPEKFLAQNTYAPLPTVVEAARQLFHTRELPYIKRARAATDPALEYIAAIAHRAQREGSRHLVLLSGVPGSGKTLVGLQLVHARWLDDLAEPRSDGSRPIAPGVYLSGNGPLVEVLQHALRDGGGGGKTFVRGIKQYVEYYSRRSDASPPEHLLVFDEAQRAHDAERVAKVQRSAVGLSEPAHLLRFCLRVPRWNVLVALIGTGQAIHVGEEVGLPLWSEALAGLPNPSEWTVHGAASSIDAFRGCHSAIEVSEALNLNQELRFHLASDIDRYVDGLLGEADKGSVSSIADNLWRAGHRFLVTRDLEIAKGYLRERYSDNPRARYGLLASTKDKKLPAFGVDNAWGAQQQMKRALWYNDGPESPHSCCQLKQVATEFSSQGLELDAALLAWGSDYLRASGQWSDRLSGGYMDPVRDRKKLRLNVYRVLLTRGRDATVVYVPKDAVFDETFDWLSECGFRQLALA